MKKAVMVIGIIVILVFVFSCYYYLDNTYLGLKKEKQNIENDLFTIKDQIVNTSSYLNLSIAQSEQINTNLQENISKINLQKIGNKYSLHEPLFTDVTQFIANDKSIDIGLEIDIAKDKGIQCAYVEVLFRSGEYVLIGFNTTDRGMVYFEPETDYQVFPIIGKKYVDCIEGDPYYSTSDDTITSILDIW